MARQSRFNRWLARKQPDLPKEAARLAMLVTGVQGWPAGALLVPTQIRETGLLDLDTLAIPYYRSALEVLIEAGSFESDCATAAARAPVIKSFCESVLAAGGAAPNLEGGAGLNLRAATLQAAFGESVLYAKALRVMAGEIAGGKPATGATLVGPQGISTKAAELLQAADASLAAAEARVKWAAAAYREQRAEQR